MASKKIYLDKYYSSQELADYCTNKAIEVIGRENITELIESSAVNSVKIIKGDYKYKYCVTNLGYVVNLTKNKILKPFINKKSGSYVVRLIKNKSKQIKFLHRLLAENFIENKYNYYYVKFKDGNTENYKLENLEWDKHNKKIENTKYKNFKYNSKSNFYSVWKSMVRRCKSPSDYNYHKYGKLGIDVCDEWLKYSNFYYWAIKNEYEKGLTIDRIDNNGNYEPDNCRWVNYTIQNINKKQNKSQSGYVGINYCKRDKLWVASLSINNKTKRLGSHKTDIKYLVELRNKYIIDNNLPHKLNKYQS